jgi:hypothetical protein
LLFADDDIFFARSDQRSLDALHEQHDTLEVYNEGSGQKIHRDKSSIFFGSHCPVTVKKAIMHKLEVQI